MANESYENSSGNIFQDLGLPNAEERLAKAKLAAKIIDLIKKNGLTQKEAAHLLKVDQPKISALYNGRLSDFNIIRLIRFLTLLEQDVEIVVKNQANGDSHLGHLSVAIAPHF